MSDYFYTNTLNLGDTYEFLDSDITDLWSQRAGQDISKDLEVVLAAMDPTARDQNVACINNLFYIGEVDFRKSARCQVQNYFLLAASAILMASIAIKCKCIPVFVITRIHCITP